MKKTKKESKSQAYQDGYAIGIKLRNILEERVEALANETGCQNPFTRVSCLDNDRDELQETLGQMSHSDRQSLHLALKDLNKGEHITC